MMELSLPNIVAPKLPANLKAVEVEKWKWEKHKYKGKVKARQKNSAGSLHLFLDNVCLPFAADRVDISPSPSWLPSCTHHRLACLDP